MVEQKQPSSSREDLIELSNSITKARTRVWLRLSAEVGLIPESWMKLNFDYIQMDGENEEWAFDLLETTTRRFENCEMKVTEMTDSGEWDDMGEQEKKQFKFSQLDLRSADVAKFRKLVLMGSNRAAANSEKRTDMLASEHYHQDDNGGGK